MSYVTKVEGSIIINPPLRWRDIKNSNFYNGRAKEMDITIQLVDTREETDEGFVERIIGVALVPTFKECFRAYNVLGHLNIAVEEFGRLGYKLEGCFEGSGKDDGDLWRLVVKDNQVKRLVPKVVWPDET